MSAVAKMPRSPGEWLVWILIAVVGAGALGVVALSRGETINALWLVVAAVATYLVAFRFYALYVANRVLGADPSRRTPAVRSPTGSASPARKSRGRSLGIPARTAGSYSRRMPENIL